MKKSLIIALMPMLLFATGCSLVKNKETEKKLDITAIQNGVCEIPVTASSSEVNSKTSLPPVSQEEKNKTFTYEDTELGVKMKYPGSCYFNKGVFQCSDFTLSVWELEAGAKVISEAEKSSENGQTQIKYTYSHGNKVYALMAWYDGEPDSSLDKVIDNIAKSLTFIK